MRTRKEASIGWAVRPLLWGFVGGIAACAVLLLIASALMAGGLLPPTWTVPLALGIAALSAFVGGFLTAKISGTKGWLFGTVSGLLLCLALTVVGLSLGGENTVGLWLKAILTVGGGILGGVLGVNAKKR